MKKLIAVALFAILAPAAFAGTSAEDVSCPAGYNKVAQYKYVNGKVVFVGYACEKSSGS